MNAKTVLTGVIVLTVALGGGSLFARDTRPPLQELPATGTPSIDATATLSPGQPEAGEPTTLTFSFTNPDGSAVRDLMTHHARRVHTLLISEDLRSIGHIHPMDFGEVTPEVVRSGRYAVEYTFPRAGAYIVGVDVMTADAALSKQFIINVQGAPRMGDVAEKDLRREKCFRGYPEDGNDRYVQPVFIADAEVSCPRGYKVTMTPSKETITAGEEVQFQYRIEKDGEAVTDLEPYLDAAIHLAIVPASFDALLHRHGNPRETGHHDGGMREAHEMPDMKGDTMGHEHATHAGRAGHGMRSGSTHESGHAAHMHHGGVPESFGPELVTESFRFPHAGRYQMFAQVKHEGRIVFSNFMVEVQDGS